MMFLTNIAKRTLINNKYLLFGLILGLISGYLIPLEKCNKIVEFTPKIDVPVLKPPLKYESSTRKPVETKGEKLIRPRYYSTELGIREKLFVGTITSEEKIATRATYINQSIAHVVDKVKYFITAKSKVKNSFNLSGIVGFTDTRSKFRPFQIVKYIGDAFLQGYDYYFLMNDYNFLNVRRLKDIVEKISVSVDVYMGTRTPDGSYCDLEAGILFSNSVLKAMNKNLEWCMINMVSDDHSENIGRCIHHSLGLECQENVQLQTLTSYKLKHFQLEKHLKELTNNQQFNKAAVIYPILDRKDFFLLNAYFARERLADLRKKINRLESNLNDTWPPGQRIGSIPATRFDLPRLNYFNMSHVFFPDDFTNIRTHSTGDLLDIENIVEAVKAKVAYSNRNLQFRKLVNGYKTFDLSRGMDYILDVEFRDLSTGKQLVKRFEVCKPLSRVEFISAPYVTENNRVTILLPVQENEIELGLQFIEHYNKEIMEKRDKSVLMLILFYQYSSPSKGTEDVFTSLKNLAMKLSSKFHDEVKIAWVSIRLPKTQEVLTVQNNTELLFAVVDLALKKIGLDTLNILLDVYCNISIEFLNRVRMNTILNFQVFNPIPFRQFDPRVSLTDTLELNKNCGHFDREEYKYVSFYGKDYVVARKQSRNLIPIVRIDNDIKKLIDSEVNIGIFDLFLQFSDNIHCMRATEKDLRVKFHREFDAKRENLFFGTKVQLAKALLQNQGKLGLEL